MWIPPSILHCCLCSCKRGRMCFSPSLSLSLWWNKRETFLMSDFDLHDSLLCNVDAFYCYEGFLASSSSGSKVAFFQQLVFLLIDLTPLWPQHCICCIVYLDIPSNSNVWIYFDHQIHSCYLEQSSAQCQKMLSPVFKPVVKVDLPCLKK